MTPAEPMTDAAAARLIAYAAMEVAEAARQLCGALVQPRREERLVRASMVRFELERIAKILEGAR